ncbi:MAG: hypothetical protein QM811_02355 [Pirellulales bacterium]
MQPVFSEPQSKDIKTPAADGKEKNLGTFLWQRYKDQRGVNQDTWWSFNEDGMWQGERSPRSAFTREPAIYKIYVMASALAVKLGPRATSRRSSRSFDKRYRF